MRVTVLGTGIMGSALARSLVRAGHTVTVWNRTAARAELLHHDKATVAETVEAAVRGAEAVLLTLFDEAAVLDVMAKGLAVAPTAVWIQASTIGTVGAARTADLATKDGVALLEAMMLGTKAPAEQGKLTLLVSGPENLDSRVSPIFDAIAARVVRVGPSVGQASALKLAVNAWIAAITAATAQSIALTRGLGLDPALFLQAIQDTPVDSAYAHAKGAAMIERSFAPSFTVDGVVKDVGLMVAAADEAGVHDDLLSTVRSLFRRASEEGHGGEDMAAVVTAFTST